MARSKPKLPLLAAAAALALVAILLVAFATLGGPNAPDQPIAFPHDLHAGSANKIPCMYCHTSADRSVDAGIPSVQLCAGCHMPGGTPLLRPERPGVKQLVSYWQNKQAIPWVRVYDLPDHVHFPHSRHVKGGLLCQDCHGPVETMAKVEKVASLRMGWCIQCHQQRKVRVDCAVCHY
ncbi:MAG TPA: cytochrome c3 family protein [Longimicrobiales bacterium]|nr:cytochrome c3 family protein [Longimicrobiales bacterium]